jgi:uncharacterized membrane protein YjgN (DUF898 family)
VILAASVPIGLVVGALIGGSLDSLTALRLRWPWLAVAGLAFQAILFTEAGAALAGAAGPGLYVASTAAVLVAVLRNIRLTGMPIVAIGSLSNLAAVVANGGVMPTTAAALAAAGLVGPGTYTNSAVLASPALGPLTDVYSIPAGLPLANVFSVGDILIALGIALVIAAAMRRSATPRP